MPFEADRATLVAYLDTHPRWTRLSRGTAGWFYGWDRKNTLADRIQIPPADSEPRYAEEDREMCAQAAIEINALVLGLPTGTPGEAVRRLLEIINVMRPGAERLPTLTDIYAVATGQKVAPVAVVITKPGYDTVRLGPIPADYAPTWIATLDKAAGHITLPEGSKWGIAAYDPKMPHEPPTAATTLPALIPIVRQRLNENERVGELMEAQRFPDEYVRMWALIGEKEAYRRWRDAVMEVDAENIAARAAGGNETR
ncbi:hypothetical protein [Nonomuraea zeae]|uniref:Uncharacterized protein n=1 Tax=Nonomuraea zeae TaxID=1642303 RepID=A0A5S4FKY2_9ACTN|nr:hypothetical protein [Nonomuraea zeae]TMR21303.1 hypothetical protein ETD85_51090 [Nonomuraea zeae]